MIHAMPCPDDDELCLRAVAVEVTTDLATRELVTQVVARSDVGGMIESVRDHAVFDVDLQQIDLAKWANVGQPGTYARRWRWRSDDRR